MRSAITTDWRLVEATVDVEGERIAETAAAELLEVHLRMARALRRIERNRTFHLSSCSSIVQYGLRLKIPEVVVRLLVHLGRALEANAAATAGVPVEQQIRTGTLTTENAALVGKVLAQPGAVKTGDEPEWFARAARLPIRTLRREVNKRIEEVAQETPHLVPITLHVTEQARDGFSRARVIASREAARPLSEGQTFALLVNHFLDFEDELRRGEKPRQVADTANLPGDRYVPAAVRHEVLRRSGDRCEVPECTFDTFLELAHVEPHADGGSREADNLVRLCHTHHVLLDADALVITGWTDGRPQVRDARGMRFRWDHAAADRPVVLAPESPKPGAAADREIQVTERPPPAAEG
jgi:hypothetical protein